VSRLGRLTALLELPLLVTSPANQRYLTGLRSSNAAILVEPDGGATIYADFRYAEAARAVQGATFVETARNLLPEVGALIASREIGFEPAHLSYTGWRALTDAGVSAVPVPGQVEKLRSVKGDDELAAIRTAAALSDDVFSALAEERFTGRTERELAWWVECAFRERGAEALSFPAIVAVGENGARPHAVPRDVTIEGATLAVVDAGCMLDGYCSDCTRTFFVGDPGDELRDAYALCAQAQLDGLAAVAPGVTGRNADAASHVAIDAAGLGWAYGHGLGHGVGIEIHEGPVLRPESDDVLAVGNVVTVEPGIYLPGVGGVRIEDLVVVTEDGCEALTTFSKEQIAVG
jgi:Xaa-Pro aminopeptidase